MGGGSGNRMAAGKKGPGWKHLPDLAASARQVPGLNDKKRKLFDPSPKDLTYETVLLVHRFVPGVRGCGGSDSAASGAVAPGEKARGPRPVCLTPRAARGAVGLVAASGNLLRPNMSAPATWGPAGRKVFVCDNGGDAKAARGVEQRIEFWRRSRGRCLPWSKARPRASAARRTTATRSLGRPADQRQGRLRQARGLRRGNARLAAREIYLMPEKPIAAVWFHVRFRGHVGKVWFKGMELYSVQPPAAKTMGTGTVPEALSPGHGQRGSEPVPIVSPVATNGPKPVELVEVPSPAAGPGTPVAKLTMASGNLLKPDAFRAHVAGFKREGETFLCDNGENAKATRGVAQVVQLQQTKPEPILAVAYSKAEGVKGPANDAYSLRMDVRYTDGSQFNGNFASFSTETHDWERRELYIMPAKPIREVSLRVVLRDHAGKAWFREPELFAVEPPAGARAVATSGPKPLELVRSPQAEPAKRPPVTVAVLDFVDKGPSIELANLRTAIAEMLAGDLSQYEGLRVAERIRVEQLLRERNLQQGFTDQAAAAQLGKALAADFLVTGSFSGKADTMTVEITLSKTGDAEPLAQWKERVPLAKLGETEQGLVAKLLAGMGLREPKRRAAPSRSRGPRRWWPCWHCGTSAPRSTWRRWKAGSPTSSRTISAPSKYVRLVEREKLRTVLAEQKLSISGLADPATAVRVGRLLGAQRLVYGSFVEMGDDLRLDVRLADSQSAAVLAAETAQGKTAEFATLLEGLSLRLAANLAVQPDADAATRIKAATPTRSIEAAIYLADGDKALVAGQYAAAAAASARPAGGAEERRRRPSPHSRLYLAREYPRAVEAGEQTLAAGFSPKSVGRDDSWQSPRVEFFHTPVALQSIEQHGRGDGPLPADHRRVSNQDLVAWVRYPWPSTNSAIPMPPARAKPCSATPWKPPAPAATAAITATPWRTCSTIRGRAAAAALTRQPLSEPPKGPIRHDGRRKSLGWQWRPRQPHDRGGRAWAARR